MPVNDFQLTVESDDEIPNEDVPVLKSSKGSKKKDKKRKREALEIHNPNAATADDASFAQDFAFDGLGGGYAYSSAQGKSSAKGDVWDLTDTIDLFKKKNGVPRVTVDEIIAKRRKPNLPISEESDEEDPAALIEEEAFSDVDPEEIDEDQSDDELDAEDFEALNALDPAQESEDDDEDMPGEAQDLSEAESEPEDEDLTEAQSNYFAEAPKQLSKDAPLPPFANLPNAKLSRPILMGLSSIGLTTPTPIQASTIPVVLLGKDVVGSSVTGSGKTVAFWVGVLERLLHRDKREPRTRVVCVCPTRELAVQVCNVGKAVARYTDITFSLCVGGLSLKVQEAELKKRPDIVVSTPGRLIDHVRNTNSFSLDSLEILIMSVAVFVFVVARLTSTSADSDEADRILEEGFRDELTEIISACPRSRSTLLFSATITEDVSELARLSLDKPVRIKIDTLGASSATLTQEFLKVRSTHSKADDIARQATLIAVCRRTFRGKTIIFFRNKSTAHKMKIVFGLVGLRADELHGNLTQEQRLTSLQNFRQGSVDYLLATDLASRGLDIKGIEYVINYEMPVSVEIYLHRVGRTARAGKKGRALTLVGEQDRRLVKQAIKHADKESIKQRTLEPELIKAALEEVNGMQEDIKEVMEEEEEEKELRRTEMELKKGENLLEHADEIRSRPARTWFASQVQKKQSKVAGAKALQTENAEGNETKAVKREKRLNHKQRRRQEARAEEREDPRPSSNGAIRNAKKAARPTKMSQMSVLAPAQPPPKKKSKVASSPKKTKSTSSANVKKGAATAKSGGSKFGSKGSKGGKRK